MTLQGWYFPGCKICKASWFEFGGPKRVQIRDPALNGSIRNASYCSILLTFGSIANWQNLNR